MNPSGTNPFPGLRPFLSPEKHLFFGRERQVAELVERLSVSRFLAVVGTSGSGKSSLVRAGLLPELHGGNLVTAGSRWEVLVMRPGGGPMQNLATALLDGGLYEAGVGDPIPPLLATLNHSRFGLVEAVRQSDLGERTNLLIIVDQFEELFRFHNQLASGDEHATDFVNLLLEATRQDVLPIYVTLTMRSDFLGDCAQFPGLAEAVNKGEYLIPRMNRDQCRLAVEGPVRVGGAMIAPRLTQRLLNEVGDSPDQLPVLQHALMRTWQHWFEQNTQAAPKQTSFRAIDLEDYEAIGTMTEALSRHADEVFESLPDEQQQHIAERLFKALTERGTDGRGVRRPVRIERLAQILDVPMPEVVPAIEAFRAPGRTFLMPMQPTELLPSTVIDISHESLMRAWRRLRRWVDEESQSARIYRRLAETAALHAEGSASLYRDPDLQIALSWRDREMPNVAWAQRYHDGFSAALAFLNASSEAFHAELAAQEAARQRELAQARALAEAERRRAEEQALHARRLRLLVQGLGIALVVATIASIFAIRSRNVARESEGRAKAATVRAEVLQREASGQAYVSMVNLAQSLIDVGRTSEGAQALVQPIPADLRGWEYGHLVSRLVQDGYELDRGIEGPAGTWALSFSPDSTRLAYAFNRTELRVRDLRTGALVCSLSLLPHFGNVNVDAITYSPDGKTLALGSETRSFTNAWFMDAETGETTRVLPVAFGVRSLAFSPNGRLVAFGGESAEVQIFECASGRLLSHLPGHRDRVNQIQFTRDSKHVITATGKPSPGAENKEGLARVWDSETGRLLRTFEGHAEGLFTIALHPTAPLAATSSWDGRVWVWNWQTGEKRFCIQLPEPAPSLCYSRDGALLLAPGYRRVSAYTAADGRLVSDWSAHENFVNVLALSPDDRLLVTKSFDGRIKLATFNDRVGYARLPAHRQPISALAASPDGTRVATAGWDHTVQIRTVADWKMSASVPIGRVPSALDFSPNGKELLTPGPDGQAIILASDSGKILRRLSTDSQRALQDAVFSPDGRAVATVGIDGYVTLLSASDGRILWRHQVHYYVEDGYPPQLAHSVRFSPDGGRLVTTGATDSSVRILETVSGGQVGAIEGLDTVRFAMFTPDGRSLLTSSGRAGSGTLTRWNATNLTRLSQIQMPAPAGVLLVTADSKRVITGIGNWNDATAPAPLRFWDLVSGRPLITVGGTNMLAHAALLPKSRLLLAADNGGSLFAFTSTPESETPLVRSSTNDVLVLPQLRQLAGAATYPLTASELSIAARPPDGSATTDLIRRSIAPREPETPSGLVDLTAQASGAPEFISSPTDPNSTVESDLAPLRQGVRRVDGVLFDVRGLVAIDGTNSPPTLAASGQSAVRNLPIGGKFHKLHSLHLLQYGTSDNPTLRPVASYRLHYADGREAVLPLVEGKEVFNAIVNGTEPKDSDVEHMLAVWNANDRFVRLWHAALENPHPDVEVRQLDLEAADTLNGTLFVAGITLESTPPVTFASQPTNQRARIGASAEFNIAVAPSLPLVYQWQRDGTDIPGATNSSFHLESVNPEDAGLYRVRAAVQDSREVVQTFSAPAALEVVEEFGIRGRLRLDYYDNIRNKFLTNLTQDPRFPNSPDRTLAIRRFETPRNVADNYGARITGFVLPPATGEYRFWIAADDQAQLFLSKDHQAQNKQLIAEELYWQSPRAWTAFRRRIGNPNVSKPVRLEQGKRYYVEVHFKEGEVIDHCAVTWQLPGQPIPENGSSPILGQYLAAPDFPEQLNSTAAR